jgi:hypothetical protein
MRKRLCSAKLDAILTRRPSRVNVIPVVNDGSIYVAPTPGKLFDALQTYFRQLHAAIEAQSNSQ